MTALLPIPAEPSLLQDEVQVFSAKLPKKLMGPDCDNGLRLDNTDLSDHCPVILLQTGGLALSVAMSHWHGALCTAHELYLWPHVLKERWLEEIAKGSYHLQLFRSDSDFPLWSAVCSTGKCLKIVKSKLMSYFQIEKCEEATIFGKGGNLIASLSQISYFPKKSSCSS